MRSNAKIDLGERFEPCWNDHASYFREDVCIRVAAIDARPSAAQTIENHRVRQFTAATIHTQNSAVRRLALDGIRRSGYRDNAIILVNPRIRAIRECVLPVPRIPAAMILPLVPAADVVPRPIGNLR
jgi:hypothetical protein